MLILDKVFWVRAMKIPFCLSNILQIQKKFLNSEVLLALLTSVSKKFSSKSNPSHMQSGGDESPTLSQKLARFQ